MKPNYEGLIFTVIFYLDDKSNEMESTKIVTFFPSILYLWIGVGIIFFGQIIFWEIW